MEKKNTGKKQVKPIVEKKSKLEEIFKEESITECLVKAIRTVMEKDKKH